MNTSTHGCPYAIKITNLKKQYRLGQIGGGTLQADISSWWAKVKRKEDPNTRIGTIKRISGDSFMALNGIDLTIYQGDAIGIIGRNGAGKSTLLKLLSRVTAPTDGEIDIYGRISSMLEVGTGFNGEMTGRENVYMNGAILGMSKAEIDRKMDDIIEFSEIGEFIDTPVKRYSSGMYAKLAFSVAAHLNSEIMIMDEVLAVGDMTFQKKCLDKMKEAVNAEGRTVLYVSHNMETIRQLCERCIVLDEGKIIFDGSTEEAIACYLGGKNSLKAHRTYEMKDYQQKTNSIIQILSTHLNHEECQYNTGEPLIADIEVKSNADMQNVHLRFQIVSKDGIRIGSAFSETSFAAIKNEKLQIRIQFPTERLIPGEYLSEIAIYTESEHETYNYINTLEKGFLFEILPSFNDHEKTSWRKNWGHTRLDDFQMEVIADET